MSKPTPWEVVVTERATSKEVKTIACGSEHSADTVARGVFRQMNRDKFFVTTRPVPKRDDEGGAAVEGSSSEVD